MMAAALILSAAYPCPPTAVPPHGASEEVRASDFFPLDLNRKLVYEQVADKKSTVTDTVGPTIDLGGVRATPIISKQGFLEISKIYYRVTEDQVSIVSYDGKYELKPAIPVFMLRGSKSSWTFEELIQTGIDSTSKEGISAKGSATLGPKRIVDGKEVETLEVIQDADVGVPPLVEKIFQRSVYGKGIGLIEMISKNTIAGRTKTSTLKLIRVESR